MSSIPLTLMNYQFVQTVVAANPNHDPTGNRTGTITNCETHYGVDPKNNNVVVEVTIRTDDKSSDNPPYTFRVTAYGIFKPTGEGAEQSQSAMNHSTQLLIGVIRQQILQLTSTMPWGSFYQGFITVADNK